MNQAPPAMAPPPARGQRLLGADLLRALATVAVIGIHASHWPLADTGMDRRVWSDVDQLLRFAVPAFLILTGVVLAYNYGDRPLTPGFMGRRLRRSLLPFVVWAPVYCATGWFFTNDVVHSWAGLGNWWLGGAGHLYYLIIVPQFYVLYLLWPRARRLAPWLAIGAVGLQLVLTGWRLYGPVPDHGVVSTLTLWLGFELLPFWIGYFAVGLWLGHRLQSPGLGRAVAVIAALLIPPAAALLPLLGTTGSPRPDFGNGSGAFLQPLLIPLAVVIALATLSGGERLLAGRPRLTRGVELVSASSLGIYILHPLLLYIPGRLLSSRLNVDLPGSILPAFALVPSTLVIALGAVRLLIATPLAASLGASRTPIHWSWPSGARPARR